MTEIKRDEEEEGGLSRQQQQLQETTLSHSVSEAGWTATHVGAVPPSSSHRHGRTPRRDRVRRLAVVPKLLSTKQ